MRVRLIADFSLVHSADDGKKKELAKLKKQQSASKKKTTTNTRTGTVMATVEIFTEAKPQYNSEWLEHTIKNNKLSNEKGSCLKV